MNRYTTEPNRRFYKHWYS